MLAELFYFVLPAILAVTIQMLLCVSTRRLSTKLLPLLTAFTLSLLAAFLHRVGSIPLFQFRLLLGAAFFILAGSAVGWFSVWLIHRTEKM